MTVDILIGTPLETDPFLELLLRSGAGDPGTPIGIYSKLAATPTRMKASRSNEKLALVTNLVADETVGLGTIPGESTVPTGGIRVFNENDRFVFFGANNVRDPVMFERTGLFYRDTQTATLPASPENYQTAVFTKGGRYFFAARTSSDELEKHEWTGADAVDPNGDWNLETPLTASAGNISALFVSPLNSAVVVQTTTPQFRMIDTDTGDWAAGSAWTNGTFLAFNSDETEFLIAPATDASDVIVAAFDNSTLTWTNADTLPTSGGANRKGGFSPDDQVAVIAGRPTSGTESPRFYSKVAGDYTYAGGLAKANHASLNLIDFAFAPDGRAAIASADSGAARVELLKRDTITPEPFTPDGTLVAAGIASGGMATRSADGLVILTATHVFRYDPVTDSYANVTPATWTSATRIYQAANEDGSIIMAASTAAVVVYTWNGSAYVVATAPGSLPTTIRACSMSPSGARMCLLGVVTTTATLRFYSRNMGTGAYTVTETLTFTIPSATNYSKLAFAPGREDLVMFNIQGMTNPRIYKHDGSVWDYLATPPAHATYTYTMGVAWHPSGDYLAVAVRDGSLNWRLRVFFRSADDTYVEAFLSAATVVNGTVAQSLAYAPDGAHLVWQHNSTTTPYALWAVTGATYTTHALPSGPSGVALTAATWDVEHLILFTTTTSPKWIYDMSGAIQTYTLETTFALTGTTTPTYVTFSPDGEVIEFGRNGDSHHKFADTPYSSLTELSFCEYTPSQVHNVLYSPSGKAVLFVGPNGPEVAVRPNLGSSFVNSRNIEGCFVFLYDLEGNNFIERSWAQHPWGSAIKDINYSPNEEVLSYHVILPVDAGEDATRGRLIWDIAEVMGVKRFDFRGQIWEEEMSNSFIAFSPWNTHFVVTHEHLVSNDHFISLHEFTVNYNYVTQDSKLVAFGPPDFSKCDDVVVAHGGAIPLTFFKHDDTANVLIPRPVDIIDWDAATIVLDVAFRDDCEGLVVLTPDEIIPLEPEGEDELKPEEPTVLDEEVEEVDEPEIKTTEIDDVLIEKPGGWKPTDPYHWDPGDPGNPVYSIAYVPYAVCTVTFRVKSIPS